MSPSKPRELRKPYICLRTYFNLIKNNTACVQDPVPPAQGLNFNQSKSYIQPTTDFFFPESLEKGPSSCPKGALLGEQSHLGATGNGASWQ